MQLRIILIIALLPSCHQPRCDEADYETDGLCVILNGEEPEQEQISYAVKRMGELFNNRGVGKHLDITSLLTREEASVKYMRGELQDDDGGILMGETNNSNIDIMWNLVHDPEIDSSSNCRVHVMVLFHEIGHIVADYHMEVSGSDYRNHEIPGLFMPESCGYGMNTADTAKCHENIEWDLWDSMYEWCTPILFPR